MLERVLWDLKTEIPSISGLATTSALTAVENKILNVSNLVKKTDCDTKVTKTEKKITNNKHDKYIIRDISSEFNKLTAENVAARLAQGNLVTKTGFDNKLINFNRKITSNKTKYLIVE